MMQYMQTDKPLKQSFTDKIVNINHLLTMLIVEGKGTVLLPAK